MRETLEREVKLDPGDGFTLPELSGEPLEERVFTSTYHDTPARSLVRAGITLRRRFENRRSLWQLKLPRENGRAEIEAPGGAAGPPQELAALLVSHLRHGPLEPVAKLRTRRSGVRVLDQQRALADVTVDDVDVLEGRRRTGGFTEVEVELVDGAPNDLDRIARTLRRAGAAKSKGLPKVLRVLELEHDELVPRDAPTIDHLRALLLRQLRELEAHDPGARFGGEPEDVHRFRVATRRSRALIRASRSLLGDRLQPLGDELKWLAGVLGPVRDGDVLLEHLGPEVERLDEDRAGGERLLVRLQEEYSAARASLLEALGGERYLALLRLFDRELASLPAVESELRPADLARDEYRKLSKTVSKLGDEPSDEALHKTRIRAKRARYAAELAASAGGKRMARFVTKLKTLQDVVGEHQDGVVAEARIRAVSDGIAPGRLIERERARRREARAAFPSAWKRVRRAGGKAFG